MTLSLQSIKYIERTNTFPSLASLTPKEARNLRSKTLQHLSSSEIQSITDELITMRDNEEITVRIYKPKTTKKLPVIVYYHGGGWVINDINTSHESCVQLAHKTQHIVISVNYRLAPEFKFPVPVNDCYDAFKWVKANIEQLGALDQVSVAGDSAGGNLATVVAIQATKEGIHVTSQILLYPVTELNYCSISYSTFGSGFGLDRDVMQWFGHHYLNQAVEAIHPLVSPLFADVTGLPKTLIIAVEHDVLRDEAIAYARKLEKNNIPVQLHIAKGLVHSYFTNNDIFGKEIATTIDYIEKFLSPEK